MRSRSAAEGKRGGGLFREAADDHSINSQGEIRVRDKDRVRVRVRQKNKLVRA